MTCKKEMIDLLPKTLSLRGMQNMPQDNFDWIDQRKLDLTIDFVKLKFEKIVGFQKYCTSYKLKHIAERHLGFYLEHGYIIAAFIIAGYDYKRDRYTTNVWHNISLKSIKQAQREASNIPLYQI